MLAVTVSGSASGGKFAESLAAARQKQAVVFRAPMYPLWI